MQRAVAKHAGFGVVIAITLLLSACATPVEQARHYARHGDWLKSVIIYRKAVAAHPDSLRYRMKLREMELTAANNYYRRGKRDLGSGFLDAAIEEFKEALLAMPGYRVAGQALVTAVSDKQALQLYRQGRRMEAAGRLSDAERRYKRAYRLDPALTAAESAYQRIRKAQKKSQNAGLALTSSAPITLNFNQTSLRTAFRFIAKSFGVNVIFDAGVQNAPVTLFAQNVTFAEALNLLLTTNKDFYKKIGPNTIIIIPNTKEKRGQYDDYLVRSWQLNAIKAKNMADILKDVLHVKTIYVNSTLNSIIVRGTRQRLALVNKLVEMNDVPPAEVVLDVEILEIDYTKAAQLGLDLGSYSVSAFVPTTTVNNSTGGIPLSGSILDAITQNAVLTLPTATFQFFKQDVDAKTLANPQIRVLNDETAQIHVGDRVPLRSSTILDPTGQVTTTYNYTDTGVKLTVLPVIHLDNSVTVKVSLQVSSLGQNLGTPTEPAYSIGTRDVQSHMLLRNGETAILGGLIRRDVNNSTTRVPWLGQIPFIGALFSNYNKSHDSTEVLLTITPHVVRGWDLASRRVRQFYSGTAHRYFNGPLFANVILPKRFSTNGSGATTVPMAPASGVVPRALAGPTTPTISPPLLAFGKPLYSVQKGHKVKITIVGRHLNGATRVPVNILYNPALLQFVRARAGSFVPANFGVQQGKKGVLHVDLSFSPKDGPKGNGTLATLVMRGRKAGISYLICQTPVAPNAAGEVSNVQARAARVLVK